MPGGDADQACAGLLHDAPEDAPGIEERASREKRIRQEFGGEVLRIVLDCTDTRRDESPEDKAPWKERKTRYLAHLRDSGERSLLVAACDKCHNLRSLMWDVHNQGLGYLDRFTGDPPSQLWYFSSIIEIAGDRIPPRLHAELSALLGDFRTLLA